MLLRMTSGRIRRPQTNRPRFNEAGAMLLRMTSPRPRARARGRSRFNEAGAMLLRMTLLICGRRIRPLNPLQ